MAADDKIIHVKGLRDLQQYEFEQEREELDRSSKTIIEDIQAIRKDLKTCNSSDKLSDLLKQALYSLECVKRIRKEFIPLQGIIPIKGDDQTSIDALKFVENETYKQLEIQLNQLIADINSFDISKGEQINESSDTEKKYLDLTLNEFLDTITDKEIEYSLKIDDAEFEGTYKQFESIIESIEDSEVKERLEHEFSDKKRYCTEIEFSQIEIYNYLKNITNDFDPEAIRVCLFDIDVYYNLDFKERIQKESLNTYIENGWEIPQITHKSPFFGKEITAQDYDTMLKKTHPYSGFGIQFIIYTLKKKLENTQNPKIDTPKNPQFKAIFDEAQLKVIYSRSIDVKAITCKEADFLYWFGGIGKESSKIKWILIGKERKPHKSALHWYCKQLAPDIKPSDMSRIFDVKLDSNNNGKGYKPDQEMKDIFNNS